MITCRDFLKGAGAAAAASRAAPWSPATVRPPGVGLVIRNGRGNGIRVGNGPCTLPRDDRRRWDPAPAGSDPGGTGN